MQPDIQEVFYEQFKRKPEYSARAPGRINLLGEHVDYNDGPVLPMAIDREVSLLAAISGDDIVSLYALDLDESAAFRLSDVEHKVDLDEEPLPDWALFPAGVCWSLREAGHEATGVQVMFTSDVPIGAGLSSSAAIEVGFGALWNAIGNWRIESLELAKICQRAENDYVGVSCGLMDQFASACGVKSHALYFDTRDLTWEAALLPPDTCIVIADSGIRRSLTDSDYNERRSACERAVELLKQYMPDITSLRDVQPTEFMAYSTYLPPEIERRAEHVVKEIARVQSGLSALHRQDADIFGALMFSSHTSLRDLYEVSTPELDTLVELARNLPGCYGARLTGAGFGGCTVNLVAAEHTEAFMDGLRQGYKAKTGIDSKVYVCKASEGASVRVIG